MKYEQLREQVCAANIDLVKAGLVILTWGNASGVDRENNVMAIKPSGVSYDILKPEHIVLLGIDSGEVMEGELNPSSDTPTHLVLYRAFPEIGGIVHTHSRYATSWAQACRDLPCFGTTHADHFYGSVPVTDSLTDREINEAYEKNTGEVIARWFGNKGVDPMQIPAALVPHHGPFVWGPNPEKAVENSIVLEEIARTASITLSIDEEAKECPRNLLDKHYLRKHGKNAYYGQHK